MKNDSYRRIRRFLRNEYFSPTPGSEDRLLRRLGITDRSTQAERRFVTAFRYTLAAAVVLVCVVNSGSLKHDYLQRFTVDGIVAISRSIDVSGLWAKLFPLGAVEKEDPE